MSKPVPPTSRETTPTDLPDSGMNDITQQASTLDISSKGQRRAGQAPTPPIATQISAVPSRVRSEGVSGDGDAGVRRSPRIAKRARSLVDEVNNVCHTM